MDFKFDEKTGKLTIVVDLNVAGDKSASGKSLVHASTRGNTDTGIKVGGKSLIVGLNGYTRI